MSDIEFDCPKCSEMLVVNSIGIGLEVKCPLCSDVIVVPDVGKKDTPNKKNEFKGQSKNKGQSKQSKSSIPKNIPQKRQKTNKKSVLPTKKEIAERREIKNDKFQNPQQQNYPIQNPPHQNSSIPPNQYQAPYNNQNENIAPFAGNSPPQQAQQNFQNNFQSNFQNNQNYTQQNPYLPQNQAPPKPKKTFYNPSPKNKSNFQANNNLDVNSVPQNHHNQGQFIPTGSIKDFFIMKIKANVKLFSYILTAIFIVLFMMLWVNTKNDSSPAQISLKEKKKRELAKASELATDKKTKDLILKFSSNPKVKELLNKYYSSKKFEEKVSFIRNQDENFVKMKKYFIGNNREINIMKVKDFEYRSHKSYDQEQNYIIKYFVKFENISNDREVFVEYNTKTDEYKIDWESDLIIQEKSYSQFLNATIGDDVAILRVFLRKDNYYNFHYNGKSSEYQCYKLDIPKSDNYLFGYTKRGSGAEFKLNSGLANTPYIKATVKLKKTPDKGINQAEILEVVNLSWYIP